MNDSATDETKPMGLLSRLFAARPDPRDAVRPLWDAVITEARDPAWYAQGGVEDSVTGRFDMVTAITSLVLVRLEQSADLKAASSYLTEWFVEDMDGQLREFGVGDMVVGKRVGKLVSTLGGRLGALRDALPGGVGAVRGVVERNVTLTDEADPGRVAARLVTLWDALAATRDDRLMAGNLRGGDPA